MLRDRPAPPHSPHRRDWAVLLPLLDEALALEGPAERQAWLATQPPEHRSTLAQLLARQAALVDSDFLAQPAALALAEDAAARAGTAHRPGQRIGPWQLLSLLGQGGMADVWLAQRAAGGLQREVALKLPRLGALPGQAERLAREGRILAQLQHPHIAPVLDAGLDDGQPWLALAVVQGQPITAHAHSRRLGVDARLALFIDVLQAVAHAHERLVVHRDIKPANVLVTEAGVVQLMDFGVAKLIDPSQAAAADTALTRLAGRPMTPEYASPEQHAGEALTTRSDIYSLGVLLYELLTGRRPAALQSGSVAELGAAARGAAVGLPSQAVADRTLARALRGDLDTIVLKALQLDPAARYASAGALAADIERHRRHLPIAARPAGALQRLRKLWRRHRVVMTAAPLAGAAVLGGLGWALVERSRAQAEAHRAEAVQAFLATTLEGNDPQVAQGRALSARELLDRSAARIASDFAATPDVQARLHQTVATLYSRLGDMPRVLQHAQAAIAGFEALGDTGSAGHQEMLFQRHEALIDLARWDEARAAVDEALAVAERSAEGRRRWAPRLVGSRGWIALQQGRLAEAMADAERGTKLQEAATGPLSTELMAALNNEAIIAQQAGSLARAATVFARIAETGPRIPGHSITDQLVERGNLANVLALQGALPEALQIFQAAVPAMLQHLGPAHDRSISLRMSWAQALTEAGRHQEAFALLGPTLADAQARGIEGDLHPTLLRAVLGRTLTQAGQADAARPLALAALADLEARHAAPTWARERARWFAGEALVASGDTAAGLALLRQARQHLQTLLPQATHPGHARIALTLAVALRQQDPTQARTLAAEACSRLEAAGADAVRWLPRCRITQAWLARPDAAGTPPPPQALLN